jgi:hypothetical protein
MVGKDQQIRCQLPPNRISKENAFHVADWASEACHLRILYDNLGHDRVHPITKALEPPSFRVSRKCWRSKSDFAASG